jgi:hypothetical protein
MTLTIYVSSDFEPKSLEKFAIRDMRVHFNTFQERKYRRRDRKRRLGWLADAQEVTKSPHPSPDNTS